MPAGRPTKYTPELLEKAWAYINGEWETVYSHAIPSMQGLCVILNIAESTCYDWRDDPEKEFSSILELINIRQRHVLIDKGLKNEHNSNITKLVLGKHGYHDKQDQTHSGPDGGPIQTDNHWTVEVIDPDA